MQIIEKPGEFSNRFSRWHGDENLAGYPFIEDTHAPFTPLRRALPLLNLALISSAGAYITGTDPFDLESRDGDTSIREIPVEVEAVDLSYTVKGYDPAAVRQDRNVQMPVDRLLAYEESAVIGQLNHAWFSISPWIPNARLVADEMVPRIVERLQRYEVQAALLVPASRLCHQTLGIFARGIELSGIPTIVISVDPRETDRVRAPRSAYYKGDFGSVAGPANWPEFQFRVLDGTLRWIETFDQPGARRLAAHLESQVEAARGER